MNPKRLQKKEDLKIEVDGAITRYRVRKKVLKWGNSAGVLLPSQLLGRTVYVELLEEVKNVN